MPSSARSTAVWRAAPADAGLHSEPAGGLIKLWWLDRTHASLDGFYLSTRTLFGSLTGLHPQSLGAAEQAAALGIRAPTAVALQRLAAAQLDFAAQVPEPANVLMLLAGLGLIGWRASSARRWLTAPRRPAQQWARRSSAAGSSTRTL